MRTTPLFLIAAVGLVAGCPPIVKNCTDIAVTSVSVDLVDADGNPILGADVTYEVDGESGDCEDPGDMGQYRCGTELDGEFTITADADGFEPGTGNATVDVDDDGCHVIGESLQIVLEASSTE